MASLIRRTPPTLLELDLTQPLLEVEPDDPIGKLRSRGKPRLRRSCVRCTRPARTRRSSGSSPGSAGRAMPPAIAQEIRDAVQVFAASGKPTVGMGRDVR